MTIFRWFIRIFLCALAIGLMESIHGINGEFARILLEAMVIALLWTCGGYDWNTPDSDRKEGQ